VKALLSVVSVMLACTLGTIAGEGVKPGVWTQDIGAAKAVAKEKGLPLLLNFTGSDWCGWCKLMDKSVFSKPEWQAYAAGKLMMVTLDFPRDKSLVPKEYVGRNEELKKAFGVSGFPTYVLLESDGETELGRLGSGKDKTPESFAKEVDQVLLFSQAGITAYLETLSPSEKDAYKVILADMERAKKELSDTKEVRAQAGKKITNLTATLEELKGKTAEFRAKKAGPDRLKEYQAVKADLAAARKTFDDWMVDPPKVTPETRAKYEEMTGAIQKLEAKLANF
jgi:thioredoxin-related protein